MRSLTSPPTLSSFAPVRWHSCVSWPCREAERPLDSDPDPDEDQERERGPERKLNSFSGPAPRPSSRAPRSLPSKSRHVLNQDKENEPNHSEPNSKKSSTARATTSKLTRRGTKKVGLGGVSTSGPSRAATPFGGSDPKTYRSSRQITAQLTSESLKKKREKLNARKLTKYMRTMVHKSHVHETPLSRFEGTGRTTPDEKESVERERRGASRVPVSRAPAEEEKSYSVV